MVLSSNKVLVILVRTQDRSVLDECSNHSGTTTIFIFMKTPKEKFQENSSEIVHMLHDLGYTPHTIVQDALNEHMDVYEYISILFDL